MTKEQEDLTQNRKAIEPEEQKQLDYLMAQAILKTQVRKGLLTQECYDAICKKISVLVEKTLQS